MHTKTGCPTFNAASPCLRWDTLYLHFFTASVVQSYFKDPNQNSVVILSKAKDLLLAHAHNHHFSARIPHMPAHTLLAALLLISAAVPQQPSTSPRPEYHKSDPVTSHLDPKEVHVDKDCRILPNPSENHTNEKATPFVDAAICHIENPRTSTHEDQKTENGMLQRSTVTVNEQDFLFHNGSTEIQSFILEDQIPREWQVDPDHPATQIVASKAGPIALYRVHANPGQTLRLHVALRHIVWKKPKPAPAS